MHSSPPVCTCPPLPSYTNTCSSWSSWWLPAEGSSPAPLLSAVLQLTGGGSGWLLGHGLAASTVSHATTPVPAGLPGAASLEARGGRGRPYSEPLLSKTHQTTGTSVLMAHSRRSVFLGRRVLPFPFLQIVLLSVSLPLPSSLRHLALKQKHAPSLGTEVPPSLLGDLTSEMSYAWKVRAAQMPFISNSGFFRGKVQSRQALRSDRSSHHVIRI